MRLALKYLLIRVEYREELDIEAEKNGKGGRVVWV